MCSLIKLIATLISVSKTANRLELTSTFWRSEVQSSPPCSNTRWKSRKRVESAFKMFKQTFSSNYSTSSTSAGQRRRWQKRLPIHSTWQPTNTTSKTCVTSASFTCVKEYPSSIRVDNVIFLIIFANLHSIENLKKSAIAFANCHDERTTDSIEQDDWPIWSRTSEPPRFECQSNPKLSLHRCTVSAIILFIHNMILFKYYSLFSFYFTLFSFKDNYVWSGFPENQNYYLLQSR